jgi:hypothetical protein
MWVPCADLQYLRAEPVRAACWSVRRPDVLNRHTGRLVRACRVRPEREAIWSSACPNTAYPAAYAEADHSPTPRGPETVVCLRSGSTARAGRRPDKDQQQAGETMDNLPLHPQVFQGFPRTPILTFPSRPQGGARGSAAHPAQDQGQDRRIRTECHWKRQAFSD